MSITDFKLAFDTLTKKKPVYDALFSYYDGDQPLVYTATRLREIFKDLDAYFAENWCSVVVDSARDRVNLREIQINGQRSQAWQDIWDASEISLESDDVHESAMVAGEGYFVAWKEKGEKTPQGYYNDPRMVHLFYEQANPRIKRMGAKMWTDEDGKLRMTLYYPEKLEYYVSQNKASEVRDVLNFTPTAEGAVVNPYKEIPIFHYRLGRRKVKSDLKNVVPIQNGINKLLTDMMVTAEYMAFPQRYIISQAEVQGKVRNAPNEILDLPAGDGVGQGTEAGQFDTAKLTNYLEAIDNMATAISSITRTPKHYFFSVGSNLSGEALIAMEAPLNKKAQDRIDRFAPVWQQAAAFMLRLAGEKTDVKNIQPIFDRPETVQPRTTAETRQMNVTAGMPLVTILREEGKSQAWIEQMLADQKAESERKQANMGEAVLNAQRVFNGE